MFIGHFGAGFGAKAASSSRFNDNLHIVWPTHHFGIKVAMAKNNIPHHVGFIPDGNRRWAIDHGLPKQAGYAYGIAPG